MESMCIFFPYFLLEDARHAGILASTNGLQVVSGVKRLSRLERKG